MLDFLLQLSVFKIMNLYIKHSLNVALENYILFNFCYLILALFKCYYELMELKYPLLLFFLVMLKFPQPELLGAFLSWLLKCVADITEFLRLYFLVQWYILGSFLAWDVEAEITPRSPSSFMWKMSFVNCNVGKRMNIPRFGYFF